MTPLTPRLPAFRAKTQVPAPSGWSVERIEDLYEPLPTGTRRDGKTSSPAGSVPVLDQTEDGVLGYHNGEPGIDASPEAPVTTFANHTCAMRFVEIPFSVIQNVFPMRGRPNLCTTRYLFYATRGRVSSTDYKGHHPEWRSGYVPLPPLALQATITAVLSAYDDLIENNNRRIKILEEMAQRLYREWFVDFRYPGHQDVPLVESELGLAPEGWAVVAFTDIADIMSGGTPKTAVAEYWGGAIPFFTPKDAPTGLVATITEKHLTEAGLERCNSDYFPAGTVFITARGTVGKVSIAGRPMAMNQSCYAVRGHDPLSQEFILLALSNQVDYLRTNTGGATFDTIIVDTFRRMKMLAPPDALISRFTHIARPLVALAQQLTETTQCARTARDLLLPRLVSGEIDVTDLDIAMPEAA